MSVVKDARDDGLVSYRFLELVLFLELQLAEIKGKPAPMNIDGATAAIFVSTEIIGVSLSKTFWHQFF